MNGTRTFKDWLFNEGNLIVGFIAVAVAVTAWFNQGFAKNDPVINELRSDVRVLQETSPKEEIRDLKTAIKEMNNSINTMSERVGSLKGQVDKLEIQIRLK